MHIFTWKTAWMMTWYTLYISIEQGPWLCVTWFPKCAPYGLPFLQCGFWRPKFHKMWIPRSTISYLTTNQFGASQDVHIFMWTFLSCRHWWSMESRLVFVDCLKFVEFYFSKSFVNFELNDAFITITVYLFLLFYFTWGIVGECIWGKNICWSPVRWLGGGLDPSID